MNRSRYWLGLLAIWLCATSVLTHFARHGDFVTFASFLACAVSVAVLFCGLRRSRPAYAAIAVVTIASRLIWGESLAGIGLAFVGLDLLCAMVTFVLATHVVATLDRLQIVVEEAVTIQLGAEMLSMCDDQKIQEEMSRSRRFDRPLTLVTVSARGDRAEQSLDEIFAKAQRELIDRYVEGRLYRLLKRHLRDSDIVTHQNGQFVVMMPETDRDFARETIDRVRELAADELGLAVSAGVAAFPKEERTLVGLLDRAATEMESKLLSPANIVDE